MAYRFEELSGFPNGDGLAQGVWHKLQPFTTSIGSVLALAGYLTWETPPPANIQVAGYAALVWNDNGRFGETNFHGPSEPILTRTLAGEQTFHLFTAPKEVDVYRDSSGYLPDDLGILYYLHDYVPPAKWRFFGATA